MRSPGVIGSGSGNQYEIKKPVDKEAKLEYSRSFEYNINFVNSRPTFEYPPSNEFESFYEVNFSMEPIVLERKDVWIVQDQDSPRKLAEKALDEEEKQNHISKRQYFMYFIDICAYMGAIWFVITKMLIGPFLDMIHQPMYIADVSEASIKCQSSNTDIKP